MIGVGTLVYFASWLMQIMFPASAWSTSALGFAAPAYTPFLWFLGIALLGRQLFWGTFYRWWMYLVLAIAFLVTHISHTALVYARATSKDGASGGIRRLRKFCATSRERRSLPTVFYAHPRFRRIRSHRPGTRAASRCTWTPGDRLCPQP